MTEESTKITLSNLKHMILQFFYICLAYVLLQFPYTKCPIKFCLALMAFGDELPLTSLLGTRFLLIFFGFRNVPL